MENNDDPGVNEILDTPLDIRTSWTDTPLDIMLHLYNIFKKKKQP